MLHIPTLLRCLPGLLAVLLLLGFAAPLPPRPQPAIGRYTIMGVSSRAQRSAIAASGATILSARQNSVEVLASARAMQQIAGLGFALRPLPLDFPPSDDLYHNYDELVADIQAVAAAHPDIVQLFSIGQSYEGRELWAAKVSDNVQIDEDEPEALFVGLYHAREHLTVEMMLYILHMLADEYDLGQPESEITQLVSTREIWLVFALNPDGGEYDISDNVYHYWRKNRQPNALPACIGTDLNRNHSYHWGNDDLGSSPDPCNEIYRGPGPASAPETAAIERFVESRVVNDQQQISVAISFHSYGELILWPYGYQDPQHCGELAPDMAAADRETFDLLARQMADTNGYIPEQSCQLYTTNGDFADWAYGVYHIFAFTFELFGGNYGFYPPGALIAAETARNRQAVLLLLHWAACPAAISASSICRAALPNLTPSLWLPLVRQ